MEFSSLIFLYLFLPICLVSLLLLRKEGHNILLLAAGLFFYAWGEGQYIALLLLSTLVNYLFGFLLDKTHGSSAKKIIFLAAIVFNVGFLVYFKYTHFLLHNLGMPTAMAPAHMPLGISFFTFQALSYIIDIYRKTIPNDTNFFRFTLYMTFFPKLVTGPITPYHNLSRQINNRQITPEDFAEGIKRFILGLGKKVLIADTVAQTANHVFAIPVEHQTAGLAWLGIITYTLQIYFDFSGYTDMAVGVGRMCGFKLLENFNYPYMAKSIKEFWTRWHISLAWWLRDYMFLPIAYAMLRKIKNDRLLRFKAENWAYTVSAMTTFFLCGVWHGANWTFAVWGAFYGILLVIEHAGWRKFMKRKIPYMRLIYTQLMVIIGWVFFRSPDMAYALGYLKAMLGLGSGDGIQYYPQLFLNREVIVFTAAGIIGAFPLFPRLKEKYDQLSGGLPQWAAKGTYTLAYNLYLAAILLVGTVYMTSGTFNPFIYFRF